MDRSLLATTLLAATLSSSAQTADSRDDEVAKTRQRLIEQYTAAVTAKDINAVAATIQSFYTEDAILQSLCPESPSPFGRDAYVKRVEGALKGGFANYAGRLKEAHAISDTLAWSTGAYSFTTPGKDGQPELSRGNTIEMLRREGGQWKVAFQAYARTPCVQ